MTARVSGSAQCRSSSTTTTAPGRASRRNKSRTASPRTADVASPRPAPPRCGTMVPSAGSQGARSGSSGTLRSRSAWSSASVSGLYGVLAPPGTARPVTTATSRARASLATSRTRRDLPIPASPVRNTKPPAPPAAALSAARNTPSSASRPTTTGHSTSAIPRVCPVPRPGDRPTANSDNAQRGRDRPIRAVGPPAPVRDQTGRPGEAPRRPRPWIAPARRRDRTAVIVRQGSQPSDPAWRA